MTRSTLRRLPITLALLLAQLLAVLTLIATPASAQLRGRGTDKATVELQLNTDTLEPDQQAIAAVVVTVRDGYHAQSSKPLIRGLIPFVVTLNAGPHVGVSESLYAPGQLQELPALGGKLSVYSGRVLTFVPIQIAADAPPGDIELTASVKLQICNDSTCDPPAVVQAKLRTTIVAKGSPQKATNGETFRAFDAVRYVHDHSAATKPSADLATPATTPRWIDFSPEALATARAGGKPVVVDFTAVWCVNCHVIERTVYGNGGSLAELGKRGVTLIKCDIDQSAAGQELLGKYNPARSIPFTAIYFPGKAEPALLTGIYSAADLLERIDDAGQTRHSITSILGYDLKDAPLVMLLLIATGVGVLLNAVPCVLPVLPLKAMSFYEDAGHDRGRSMLNGGVFSLGIVVTFGVLALLVITQNALWGKFISHPITAGVLGVVLLGAAAQAFGLFDIVLPRSVTNLEGRTSGASLVSNFFSGMLIAVLSTPCTIGMFAAVIAVAIASGRYQGPLTLMFVGVGMALPWFVLSAFPEVTRKFPRTGPWPSIVKQMMGFLLIGTAIFFVQPLLPNALRGNVMWWLIFACVVASAIFLLSRTVQIAPRARPIAIASVVALVWVGFGLVLTLALAT